MRFKVRTLLILLFTPFTTLAQNSIYFQNTAPDEIKIMQYNVENLFNTVHNPGKKDYEFLPADNPEKTHCQQTPNSTACLQTNWTKEKLAVRLNNLALVMELQGSLPDVLAIEEIESEDVVQMVARRLGYSNYVFRDGPDNRGIDTAILFNHRKLNLLKWDSVPVRLPNNKVTRDILVAVFSLVGHPEQILAVMANHWPSLGSPNEFRIVAAQTLMSLIAQANRLYGQQDLNIVALGDFNTLEKDSPNPVYDYVANPNWSLRLYDSLALFTAYKFPWANQMPPGTTFYPKDMTWNQFDKILVSRSLLNQRGLEMIPSSFRIIAPPVMSRPLRENPQFLMPRNFNQFSEDLRDQGFSDHYPVVLKLKMH